ncbi:MAG: hypothetical protein HLUCCO02_06350 [Idiomarinaceae bacterium HL-53]|nr:MAG: hypothetical protein HLUCCO02_06350 [Idiomarinaceae bacterium HL-53]CUS48174.1 Protein of unknown function (DUF2970) [Idiomarinaceae bacterium HL-53]
MTEPTEQKPTFWDVVMSVLAAMFGVQTERNRRRDFNQKSGVPYIVVGVVFIVLFVLTIFAIVSLVMKFNT